MITAARKEPHADVRADIRFWSLDDDRDITLADAGLILSGDEQARAARFVFDRDRHRFIRGRGLMRQALGDLLETDPKRLVLTTGSNGKPEIAGSRLNFNLSHTQDFAVFASDWSAPIGIDLEYVDRSVDVRGLAPRVFGLGERTVLDSLDERAFRRRFFEFWTAKEARMKVTGEGMSLDPLSIELELTQGHVTGVRVPDTPVTDLVFIDAPQPGLVCCLARATD